MQKRKHMPKDTNLLARQVVRMATGKIETEPSEEPLTSIQEAARLMGKKGGSKGGRVRAERMTLKQLSQAGRKAALERWARANKV